MNNNLVNIIDKWEVLEEYAGEKLGFYQIRSVGGRIEIRVMTGKVGFVKEFDDGNDKLLTQITDFCNKRHFIQISDYLRDEDFFK